MLGLSNIKAAPRHVLAHWRFLRREGVLRRREAALVILLSTLTVAAEAAGMTMILPILSFVEHGGDISAFSESSRIAQVVVETFQSFGIPVSLISLSVAAMLLVLVRQSLNYFNSIEIERMRWHVGRRLAVLVFSSVLGSHSSGIRKHKAGQFLNVVTQESAATAAILRSYGTVWMQLATFSAYGIVLFMTSPTASLLAVGVIAVAMLCLGTLVQIVGRLSRKAVGYRRENADFLVERFRAWKLIKLSNTLKTESDQVDRIQSDIVSNEIKILKASGALALIFVPVLTAFMLATLYVFVEVLGLQVSAIMLFILILARLLPVSQALQGQLARFAQLLPSYQLVERAVRESRARHEALDEGPEIESLRDAITFDAVTFTYPERDQPALKQIDLSIPVGRMTAVVGHSGAGKSTLVDLIPRIIDPDAGQVLFDGKPIREFSLRSVRRLVTYVPQEPFLFDASLADNIRYLKPEASVSEVQEAARLANAADFIEDLPDGYETNLGDQGAKLSGGQRQRIVLARAFLLSSPILILDEPTSALDYESEAAIQRALESLVSKRGLTVIVIAHRLSTIRNADVVVHLKQGRLHAFGPAKDVLRQVGDLDLELVPGDNASSFAAQ